MQASLKHQTSLPDRLDWDTFIKTLDWNQGEHVAVIGPTGCGKSTLMRALVWRRDWVVSFCTKKKDSTYDDSLRQGYKRVVKWPPPKTKERREHLLLWPKYEQIGDIYASAPVFRRALEHIFVDEGWCICLDDLYYLSTKLKLANEISAINYQVRSMGVTLVSGMQRPKKVPLETWDQASHAFVSRIGNYDDLQSIRGLSQVDARTLKMWVGSLRKHEWLYLPVAKSADLPPVIVKPSVRRTDG